MMIIVTGASGLVGEAIHKTFASRRDEVAGTSFSQTSPHLYVIDLKDPHAVKTFLQGKVIDLFIHCAAITPTNSTCSQEDIYQGNMVMLENIFSHLSRKVCFIYISSTAIYDLRGDSSLNENSPLVCDNSYQRSKKDGEDLVRSFYQDTTNYLSLRISSPYSVRRKGPSILNTFVDAATGPDRSIRLWGTGGRRQALTNVDMLARALPLLVEKGARGEFNYVTTPSVSMLQLAQKIKRHHPPTAIVFEDREDPEEQCRTLIDTGKIASYVALADPLDNDLKSILAAANR